MTVEFSLPLESAENFPIPTIHASPKLRPAFLTLKNQFGPSDNDCIFTKNGRGAITIAGQMLKRPGKNVILIPAYHCPALVEPFIWLMYEVRFYPLQSDLSFDPATLEKILSQGDITHCVLIRYFGFMQNIDIIEPLLKQHGVSIIEDCAHAFFAIRDNITQNDSHADAQICSINKLLPSIDGGILRMTGKNLPKLRARSWKEEIKGIASTLGISDWISERVQPSAKKERYAKAVDIEAFRNFIPDEEHIASFRYTKLLTHFSSLNKIRRIRRDNFNYLVSHIKDCKAGTPLYTELKENEVPYVLPFLLNDKQYFKALRMEGIQLLRWEEIAKSDCRVSNDYRHRLVQIPCHHQLLKRQLDKLISTITELG